MVRTILYGAGVAAASLYPAHGQVVAYPAAAGLPTSAVFSVWANGQLVPVANYLGKHIAWFSFSGTANVRVSVHEDVTSFQLSPKRHQIAASANGRDITFALTEPRKLVIHRINALADELLLFADPPETGAPNVGEAGVFNIQGHGALPDAPDSSAAIQRAIDAASAYSGGGTAYVPAGRFNIASSVWLKSHVRLHLEPGAVISINSGSYHNSVALAIQNAQNVRISGRGIIYAGGSSALTQLQTSEVQNLRFDDVMFLAGPTTLTRFGRAVNSGLYNIKVLAGGPGLADGLDFDGAFNFTVQDCFVLSTDDNVAIGSATDQLDFRRPVNTDGLTIRGNVFHQSASGHMVSIVQHVAWQYIQNVLIENNDSITVLDAFGIYPSGSQVQISGITYRNNRLENVRAAILDYQSVDFYAWGGCSNGFINHESGSIHNVVIDNLIVDNLPPRASHLVGRSSWQDLANIRVNNLIVAGQARMSAAAANFSIGSFVSGVQFTSDSTPIPSALARPKPTNIPIPADTECGGSVKTPAPDPVFDPLPPPPPAPSPPALTALRVSAPISIDGSLADWTGADFVKISGLNNSATVYALWNDSELYVAYRVRDSQLNAAGAVRDSGSLWNNDAVELFLDTLRDGGSSMRFDDFHFIVDLNNVQYDAQGTGSGETSAFHAPFRSAISARGSLNDNRDADADYTVELAVPLASIGLSPASGTLVGIELSVSDSDASGFSYFDLAGIASTGQNYGQPDLWPVLRFDGTAAQARSACDANQDGSVNVADVQTAVNQVLDGTCAIDLNQDGLCTVADVQRVVNAALGGQC